MRNQTKEQNSESHDYRPVYIILFDCDQTEDSVYSPYLDLDEVRQNMDLITHPHGLSRQLVPSLRALWFCLHLPATVYDLYDRTLVHVAHAPTFDLAHNIILMPDNYFQKFIELQGMEGPAGPPIIIIAPDSMISAARNAATLIGFPKQILAYSDLREERISKLWRFIHKSLAPDYEFLGNEPKLSARLDHAPFLLPTTLLLRQLDPELRMPDGSEETGWLKPILYSLRARAYISALAKCEKDQMSISEADVVMSALIDEETERLRIHVSLVSPGVPPSYSRKLHNKPLEHAVNISNAPIFWNTIGLDASDLANELATMGFVATHRAIARGGIAIVTPSVPPSLFVLLADLERHFAKQEPKPPAIRRWLQDIGEETCKLLDDGTIASLRRASFVTCFSNFPIGLAVLPGDTSPLCCRVPIAYRPVMPLMRTLQTELMSNPATLLSIGLKVLVLECIDRVDRVGRASRQIWPIIVAQRSNDSEIALKYMETLSPEAVTAAIAAEKPDVVVISAHGEFRPEANYAGIVVGSTPTLGDDLGHMPPLVVLSACHVAPRGTGSVNIADLLIRQGALAVIGTFTPVDVVHNATLISRFFTHLGEAVACRTSDKSVADAWNRTTLGNAFLDITSGNQNISSWLTSNTGGKPVMMSFMEDRSVGRLRPGHIYADTERVLREMAVEMDIGNRFDAWITTPGYVPASLFYCMIGWPENILLQRPTLGSDG